MCHIKQLEIENNDFQQTDFYQTALAGVDLSTNHVEGIRVDGPSLKGAIMSPIQVVDCAGLFGIKVKG